MIPNHARFLEAIQDRKKVNVRFYSSADSGVVDRICAPLDYGPGDAVQGALNRYWLWDYSATAGSQAFGLAPQQIVELQVLGEQFDPGTLDASAGKWSVAREWGSRTLTPPDNSPPPVP